MVRAAIENHNKLEGISERWYMDDNDDPESSELLQGEKLIPVPATRSEEYRRGTFGHLWTPKLMFRMADIRNAAIREFLNSDADALFMIDTDVFAHPHTAVHLAGLGKPIVSEVYWSQWNPGEQWLPNVWDIHYYRFTEAYSILRLREAGLYEVGGLGAITLLTREALELGIDYRPIPTITADYAGEDRHFCIRATAAGVPLFADTHYPPFHVFRSEQFDEMKAWQRDGSHPGYFRKHWLTKMWAENIARMFR